MDLVAHLGDSTEGFYLDTLSAVDVATGWVECRGALGKGQERVGGAIHHIGQKAAIPPPGDRLGQRLRVHQPQAVRLLPEEGDQVHPFQVLQEERRRPRRAKESVGGSKAHGYEQYRSKEALEQLKRAYRLAGLYVNFFQPTMQLQEKTLHGARVHKVYDIAKAPYRRLLEHGALSGELREEMEDLYCRLNPAGLLRQIQREQERLWIMAENNGSTQTLGNNNI